MISLSEFYRRRKPHVMRAADADDTFDYLFKVVLIGDPGVGKTCIVQRFKKGTFVERHGSTIGVDFTMKTLSVDSTRVKVRKLFVLSGSNGCVSVRRLENYPVKTYGRVDI